MQQVKKWISDSKIYNKAMGEAKNHKLLQLLQTENRDLISRYNSIDSINDKIKGEESPYIWVCWWQGENEMTHLVKYCYRRICNLNTDKTVILITDDNLEKYADFDEIILQKFRNGLISKTNMSDLLRFNLLSRWGGAWMDITILPSKPIPKECYQYPIYSCKEKEKRWAFNVSHSRWTSFFWVSREPNNIFMRFMNDFWNEYWHSHDELMEYFLVDYAIALAYKTIPIIRKQIDHIPVNGCGSDCWQLLNEIRKHSRYSEDELKKIQNDGWFQKLSYKGEGSWAQDQEDTYYRHMFLSQRGEIL